MNDEIYFASKRAKPVYDYAQDAANEYQIPICVSYNVRTRYFIARPRYETAQRIFDHEKPLLITHPERRDYGLY